MTVTWDNIGVITDNDENISSVLSNDKKANIGKRINKRT